ncbi:GNAT family N-acetyltransferase [Agaribacterium haliotis]|uniref:GNAT family N-acetyltransferase n=1 Tax=Agaribacterium haliotis TaxID=2013869 RepID=UPI000BB57979|nr:GNAT family N-acetyltransferase [Agaribacterium haliotis]
MSNIEYLNFNCVDAAAFTDVLNEESLRTHLIEHPRFDAASAKQWINEKSKKDKLPGCRLRVLVIDGELAGWCGIQPDEQGFELAIVVSKRFWGAGLPIFKTLMTWAAELGHREVLFHLLDSRREYKALAKIAKKVEKTELLGRHFTTYYLAVA